MTLKNGMVVQTDDNKIGEVKFIKNGIVTLKLKDGTGGTIYRYLKQIVKEVK
jgi:hypothetical protein